MRVAGEVVVRLTLGCSPGDHHVVTVAHAADGLDDLGLVILDDFDPLQVLPGFGEFTDRRPQHGGRTIPRPKHHLAK